MPARFTALIASLLCLFPLALFAQDNQSDGQPLVIAHRGLLKHAPENTLANFRACLELRIGFEVDVRRSQDGMLVCVHDDTVDRTTSGRGAVSALSLAELKKLTGVSDFAHLSPEDTSKIMQLIGQGKLNQSHIQSMLQLAPHFAEVAAKALHSLTLNAAFASTSQTEALRAVTSAIEGTAKALSLLAAGAETDSTREKIAEAIIKASEVYLKLVVEAKAMNTENNNWFARNGVFIVSALFLVVGTLAGAAGVTLTSKDKEA